MIEGPVLRVGDRVQAVRMTCNGIDAGCLGTVAEVFPLAPSIVHVLWDDADWGKVGEWVEDLEALPGTVPPEDAE